MLAAQVFRRGVPRQARQGFRHGGAQRWGAQGEIHLDHGLTGRGDQLLTLHPGDRSAQPSGADQLLLGPGRLPDQQTEGVSAGVAGAGLILTPELLEVGGNVGGWEFERGLEGELGRHGWPGGEGRRGEGLG